MMSIASPSIILPDFDKMVMQGRDKALTSLSRVYRGTNGQFFTPYPIARFMASLQSSTTQMKILDAGAGIGALTLAAIEKALIGGQTREIDVVCFENESRFLPILESNLCECKRTCESLGLVFSFRILNDDFILSASRSLSGESLFNDCRLGGFTHAILNPPYKKLRSDSEHRKALCEVGIETSNLYTAFLWLSLRLLAHKGELTAITPRSFCSGLYFRPFRQELRRQLRFTHIHSIEERRSAFSDDDVLQENIIFHGVKESGYAGNVMLSSGNGSSSSTTNLLPEHEVITDDNDAVINLVLNRNDAQVREMIESLPNSLSDLGIQVSTGPVVDFRVKEYLSADPVFGTEPLIYPCHFEGHTISWPRLGHKKPNGIFINQTTESQLLPVGYYTLVKRFTAKEETKRVVATVLSPFNLPHGTQHVGIENHINYFHAAHRPLPRDIAQGLAYYLNSSVVDAYLRIFNGHTQVNATDLRRVCYPAQESLHRISTALEGCITVSQTMLDETVNRIIFQNHQETRRETA